MIIWGDKINRHKLIQEQMSQITKAIFILLMTISFNGFGQIKVDTVIKTSIYESYFSYETKTPLYVKYKLYHGGGDCKREGMTFSREGVNSLSEREYAKSGLDIGHMANAEDFAFDCIKEKETFRFYNALPQYPQLNRGSWKVLETEIRKESQIDSLLIICGGWSFRKEKELNVPDYCFKIVKNLRTGEVKCYEFTNNKVSETHMQIPLALIPYNIEL